MHYLSDPVNIHYINITILLTTILRCISYIKMHIFNVYNFMHLNISICLWNHHYHQSNTFNTIGGEHKENKVEIEVSATVEFMFIQICKTSSNDVKERTTCLDLLVFEVLKAPALVLMHTLRIASYQIRPFES